MSAARFTPPGAQGATVKPSEIPEDEAKSLRRSYHLGPYANLAPWAVYAQLRASWRGKVGDWLVRFLSSPEEYTRRMPLRPCDMDAYAEARQQILDLAKPDQRPLELAHEIMERGNRSLILELAWAGWLPKPPVRPGVRAAQARPTISHEERAKNMENAFL